MTRSNGPAANPAEYVERRIRSPLEAHSHQRSVGLTQIVGTHGTQVESVVALARDGSFSGGDRNLQGTFHLTPNLLFSGWKKTDFAEDISAIVDAIGLRNPLDISRDYAESGGITRKEDYEGGSAEGGSGGIVLAFSGKVLNLVRAVDIDETKQEPEVVLHEAPPLESVRAIYPVDGFAHEALVKAIGELQ